MARSPRRRIRLVTVIGGLNGLVRPGSADQNLRRLDTSNGCQDHTVLPSAERLRQEVLRTVHARQDICEAGYSAVRPARLQSLTAEAALRSDLRARRCRVHRIPPQRS